VAAHVLEQLLAGGGRKVAGGVADAGEIPIDHLVGMRGSHDFVPS
jgi:hypothetical protein